MKTQIEMIIINRFKKLYYIFFKELNKIFNLSAYSFTVESLNITHNIILIRIKVKTSLGKIIIN